MSLHPNRGTSRRPAPLALAIVAGALGCLGLAFGQETPSAPAAPKKETKVQAPAKKEVGVIKTTMGTIVFEFLPDVAPKMVENFKDLAKSCF